MEVVPNEGTAWASWVLNIFGNHPGVPERIFVNRSLIQGTWTGCYTEVLGGGEVICRSADLRLGTGWVNSLKATTLNTSMGSVISN